MGMDVIGKHPVTPTGEYFRNNVWWWRPLWNYCQQVSDLAAQVDGHYNDGNGLDEAGAKALAQTLLTELNEGRTSEYAAKYHIELDTMPEVECDLCHGSGHGSGERHDENVDGECNACQGKGTRKHWATMYPFSIDNVREFAEFLQDSGGFEIW